MSDPTPSSPPRAPLERVIEALDRPLLLLALGAVALYLAELRGIVSPHGWARGVGLGLDVLFLVDLGLKLAVQRGRYLGSAWVTTDVLSCLPALALLAHAPWLDAVRFARLFRFLRILRSLRVLRALHLLPSLTGLAEEGTREGRRFRVAVNLGVLAYAGVFLALVAWLHHDLAAVTADQLARSEFFLVSGALLATALFLFLMHYHLHDSSWNQLRQLLNIALPRQVAEHLLHHPEAYHERHRADATTVFIDFVGFTATAERMGADVRKLAYHLEQAMDCVVERLVARDLIIDKFIGDAVMAFRGGPLVAGDAADHARRVVLGSLEAARALAALKDPYFQQVKLGIASARCLIGAFGTSRRLSYTALGDGVNLAARLEPASAQCGAQVLVCDATRQLAGDLPGVVWRRWGTIAVKGKVGPQVVWEALDPEALPDHRFLEVYHRARRAFESDGPAAARPLFAEADAARPGGDRPSQLHVQWCDELLAHPGTGPLDTSLHVSK